jgi:hypothetical protein
MLRQAFEESFQVKELQRSVNGLIAYDSPFVSFESVRFQEGAEKPVLQALEDLSKKLCLRSRIRFRFRDGAALAR